VKRGTNADPTPPPPWVPPWAGHWFPVSIRCHICHLQGSRGGRSSPHVECPGRPPRRQPMCPWDKEFKLIEPASRPVGKKWGYPAYYGLSFQCLTLPLRLSQPQSRRQYTSYAYAPPLPPPRRTLDTLLTCPLDPPRLPSRRASRLATWRGEGLNIDE